MTRDETKSILAAMATVYSLNLMPQITELTVNTWFQLLADLPYKPVQAAVVAWIATEKYPPTIADIREKALVREDGITAAVAWGMVIRAVRKYGADWWLAKADLPDAVWAVCEQRGWDYYCNMDERESNVCFAQFRGAFETEVQRERRRLQIPQQVWETLARIADKSEVVE